MAEIPNRPNPLNQYSVINCTTLTATNATITNVNGATTLSGSTVQGSTGSIKLNTYGTATGSKIASLYLVCTVTGSTYHLALYSPT